MGAGKEAQDKRGNKAAGRNAPSKYRSTAAGELAPDPVDWGDVDPATVVAAIRAVVAAGDAITFTRSRDGGAYSVTVLADGLRHFHRQHEPAEIERELREIAEDAAAFAKWTGD